MRSLALALCLAATAVARAETTVTVQLSPEGEQLAQQIGASPAELVALVRARVDDVYATADIDEFLEAFTDATSFSARGIGADYGSTPQSFIVGVGANIAAAGDSDIRSDERPTAGLAANVAVMAGLNLSEWGHPRWTVYANGFYRNAAMERLEGDILTLGAHVQYNVFPPAESGGTGTMMRWIGVSVTSGVELTKWKLGAGEEPLTTDFVITGSSGEATLVMTSTGRLDLTSTSVTVPIEVTTGIRIALLATLYIGAAVDVTAGSSQVDASLSGMVRSTDGRDIGTVVIAGTDENNGNPLTGRIIAGVQANLWKLKLFAQVNASQVPSASIAFGLRFVQ